MKSNKLTRFVGVAMSVMLTIGMFPGMQTAVYAEPEPEEPHVHCICGAEHEEVGDHKTEDIKEFTAVVSENELPEDDDSEAYYLYLADDIELTSVWMPEVDTVLCLNGHTIKPSSEFPADVNYLIQITGDVKFTLTDCNSENPGQIIDDSDKIEYGIVVSGENTGFDMYGGEISGVRKTDSSRASAVYNHNSTFNMYGGSIHDNGSPSANGIGIYNAGTLNMYGGSIHDNGNPYANGSGIYNAGMLNMYGGSIHDNGYEWDAYGGGIYNTGTINMHGGYISANKAKCGGGIYNYEDGTLNINGGEVEQNSANDAGGIYNFGTLNINGGSIHDNETFDRGGGIWNFTGTLNINGGEVEQNSAKDGGGIYNYGGQLNILNGNIKENNAKEEGGGIYNRGDITICGNTTIDGNTSKSNGGGIYNLNKEDSYTTYIYGNAAITNNSSGNKGGGVWQQELMYLGGSAKITGNTSTEYGSDNLYLIADIASISFDPDHAPVKGSSGMQVNLSTYEEHEGEEPVVFTDACDKDYSSCFKCDVSGNKIRYNADKKLEIYKSCTGSHSYGEWTVTIKPTSTSLGRRERTCSVCGEKQYDTIPMTGTPEDEHEDDIQKGTETKAGAPVSGNGITSSKSDLYDSDILTDDEKASISSNNAYIWLEIDEATDDEKNSIKSKAEETFGSYDEIIYFDAKLFKQIDGKTAEQITSALSKNIKIGVILPKNKRKNYTVCEVMRLHDDTVDALDTSYDEETGEIDFATDRFSTYAVVLTEKNDPVVINAKQNLVLSGAYTIKEIHDGTSVITDAKQIKKYATVSYKKKKKIVANTILKTKINKKAAGTDGSYEVVLKTESDDSLVTYKVEMLDSLSKYYKGKNTFTSSSDIYKDAKTAISSNNAIKVALKTIKGTDSTNKNVIWYVGKTPLTVSTEIQAIKDSKGNAVYYYMVASDGLSVNVVPAYGSKKSVKIIGKIDKKKYSVTLKSKPAK